MWTKLKDHNYQYEEDEYHLIKLLNSTHALKLELLQNWATHFCKSDIHSALEEEDRRVLHHSHVILNIYIFIAIRILFILNLIYI